MWLFSINCLFIEFTENTLHCDMYRHLAMKSSLSGYQILVLLHSPRACRGIYPACECGVKISHTVSYPLL